MGGIVAMEVLRRAPDRVTRLALMDTNALSETPKGATAYEPLIVGARAGRIKDVVQAFIRPDYLAPGPHRGEVMELIMDMAITLGPEIFVNQARALQRRRDHQSTFGNDLIDHF